MGARFRFYDFFYKGGTNFGFMNGANVVGPQRSYLPTITSYGMCLFVYPSVHACTEGLTLT